MLKNRVSQLFLLTLSFLLLVYLCSAGVVQAQDNWTALPPYNTLWPLWSPVLSPVDATTGLPVPVVSSLGASTVLPVQPGLTWDPSMAYPWLLYNTPIGLAYFDPLFGINFWPPSSFLDSAGAPVPIGLPDGFNTLAPTDPLWLQQNVLFANSYFVQAYHPLLATADPALLIPALPINLAPPALAAINAGLPIPGLTALFPAPGILDLLTPAAILGL